MLNILRGLGYLITQAAVQNFHKLPSFARLGNGFLAKQGQGVLGFIPLPVVYMIVIFIVIWLVMARTTFGRYVYAVGGNPRAAALSGIRTKLIKTVAFVVMGVLGAVSGIILLSRHELRPEQCRVRFRTASRRRRFIGRHWSGRWRRIVGGHLAGGAPAGHSEQRHHPLGDPFQLADDHERCAHLTGDLPGCSRRRHAAGLE